MTKKQRIAEAYYQWMTKMMTEESLAKTISYEKVFRRLHGTEFTCDKVPEDENRAEDGVYLRYRFIIDNDYDTKDLDYMDGPCSILELMVALAIRCEENIMSDPRYGDRTEQWFWYMMVSLGLGGMSDDIYDEEKVSTIITKFLNREYEPNGKGSLFLVKRHKRDFRNIEIWNQLYEYLNTIS